MWNMEIVALSTSMRMNVNVGGVIKYAFFEDVVRIDLSAAALLPGDSGSVAIAQSDNRTVGIIISTNLFYGFFCKLTF